MTDEREPPSGTEHTIAAPVTNPASAATVAAPSARAATQETLADNTLVPSSDVARRAAGTSPSSKPGSKSDSQARSVGQEMQAATIQRFGTVHRDRFELLDELARGGLGRVFRARDPRTNRIVAIKEVLRPTPDIIARFAREALVTANLQHPAIVPVYEVGRWESGEPFYAMKLVQGRTLDALIDESSTLDARMTLVPHLIVVADALAYAHSEHVIHRDLKPANILVGAYGETVVIDWGLAKNLVTGEELDSLPHASTIPPDNEGETMIGAVLGTPAYMPPEQAIGEKVDEHADVYAIGAILYHVLAGVRPYRQARTMEELLHRVATEAPQPVRELAPDAPPELIAIVEKAMARRPEDRYATAEGLAHDLRAFQAGKLVAAHRYTTRQLIRRWIAKHRGMVLTAVVALGVLITIAAIGVWRIAKERDVAQAEREEARAQRAEAQTQRTLAEERFATSLEELARQSLVSKSPDKALPLLVGALNARDGKTTPTFDVLADVARSTYGGLVGFAPPHTASTSAAGLASGRNWVISSSIGEGIARAWDLTTNREMWRVPGVELLAVSPDGTAVFGSAPTGELKVLDAITGKLLHSWKATEATPERTHVLAWTPDGSRFAAAAKTGAVFLGDPTSSTLRTLDPHTGVVWTAAFSPDSKLLATAGADGVTMIRDAATGATLAQLGDGPSEIASLAWVDAGRLVTGDGKGIVRLWSIGERRVVRRYKQPADVYGVLVGGDVPQRWVAAYGHGEVATVWDVETGAVRATLGGHTFGSDVGATAAGLLVTTDETGNTFVWDPLTGERVQTLPNEGTVFGIETAGDRIVVFGGRRIRVWQLARDRVLRAVPGHTARIRDLAWSADGGMLFTASSDGTARGLDLTTGATTVLGTSVFSEPPISDLNT
ncbi:MAG: protein kinase, partial [Deltaproteobacteria bacterium]|nr:protein kinase [Deltaproteobacteria bacterium]